MLTSIRGSGLPNQSESFLIRAFKRKSSIAGLIIITIFILIGTIGAATAPYSNGYNPNQYLAAGPDALPSWVTLFPGYHNLPPNIVFPSATSSQEFKSASAVAEWQPADPQAATVSVSYDGNTGPTGISPSNPGAYTIINTGPGSELLNITGNSQNTTSISFVHSIEYNYNPPEVFVSQLTVKPISAQNAGVAIFLYVKAPQGLYPVALAADPAGQAALESEPKLSSDYLQYFSNPIQPILQNSSWNYVGGITTADSLMPLYYLNSSAIANANPSAFASTIFRGPGNYTFGELIQIFPKGSYNIQLQQSDLKFQIFGQAYGLLGTDIHGSDVWSEFATGTNTALLIAFGASAIALSIGVVVGLIAGFFGGLVDGSLLFFTDVLLLLPGLILLIDLDTIFTLAHVVPNKVVLLVVLFGALGWPGIMRTVRSQTLSLRSRTYVQAATSMGASRLYVLRRHVLNHTAGTIIALTTLVVPGLVAADAGIDFLGLGISTTPTWGNMLAILINSVNPANGYLWWIFLPVGIAIILISISFFMTGRAIQQEYSRAA
jgi:peptide/nickel transport system permease protein